MRGGDGVPWPAAGAAIFSDFFLSPPASQLHSCDVAGGHDYVYENISSPARCEFGRPVTPLFQPAALFVAKIVTRWRQSCCGHAITPCDSLSALLTVP